MTTKMIGTPGSTHAQVDGTDYDVDEDGFFHVDNGDHVKILRGAGFRGEGDVAAKTELEVRYPLAMDGVRAAGVEIFPHMDERQVLTALENKLRILRAEADAATRTAGDSEAAATTEQPEATAEQPEAEETNFDKMTREGISLWLAERGVTMAPTEVKAELVAAAQAKLAESIAE